MVNTEATSPDHYTQGDIECIDAIRSALGEDGFQAYCRGNVIKYAWRAGTKVGNTAEMDMQKAMVYASWAADL